MPFGQYKGALLSELPADYLAWLLSLGTVRDPLRTALFTERERRATLASLDLKLARSIVDTGFRALAKQAHPDAGGELRTMQRLNEAVSWLRQQIEVSV
jgi:hypothetical protein